MAIRVDDTRFPLVVTTFEGSASDSEFDAYLVDTTKRTVARKTPNVVIVDATAAARPTATQRKKQADWLAEHRATLEQLNLGTVFVIANPLIRGGLTAIFWISPMPSPTTVVATYAQAEVWAFERLREAGIQPPPSLAIRSTSR